MQKLIYKVQFVTPAFLGGADQTAQWRTPPFKALLRQWWRVRAAKECNYNHKLLREKEGKLFGNTWLKTESGVTLYCKSTVLLKLNAWESGRLTTNNWPDDKWDHVVTTQDGRGRVRADVYLGFGPVLPPSKKENRPVVTVRPFIGENHKAIMSLYSEKIDPSLQDVLQLIAWFGSVGSRSRNGWGSLHLEPAEGNPVLTTLPNVNDKLLNAITRPWTECLKLEWPHAIGLHSGKPLIWISKTYSNWREVIGCLANVRVSVRSAAKRFTGPDGISGIHLLGYPAGEKWNLTRLGTDVRLATQLRFKVVKTEEGLVGMVTHFPCAFPEVLKNNLTSTQQAWLEQNEQRVWEEVHRNLNTNTRVKPLC